MEYLKAFLIGGAFCLIGQILIDKTKLNRSGLFKVIPTGAFDEILTD